MSPAGGQLLIVGAGGFARETIEAIRAINAVERRWELLGVLDDDPARRGSRVGGVEVLGPAELVHERPEAHVVICTGNPRDYGSRRRIAERLRLDEARYATLVHPTVTMGESCRIGAGSVLLAHVDLTADVVVGRHVAIMPQVVLPHDARVDDWATIASGVRLSGACEVGAGAYVGAGALLREGVSIGAGALVGMGSLVTCDVPAERLWFGSPARDVRHARRRAA